jgi:Zn-dependent M28 family amino/carboxypeptidase
MQLFFMMGRAPSPGAVDNLNSTCIAVSIAQYFAAACGGSAALRHTRLIVLSTDGEEIRATRGDPLRG